MLGRPCSGVNSKTREIHTLATHVQTIGLADWIWLTLFVQGFRRAACISSAPVNGTPRVTAVTSGVSEWGRRRSAQQLRRRPDSPGGCAAPKARPARWAGCDEVIGEVFNLFNHAND